MTIEMGCVECGRLLRLKDDLAGKRIKCPHCAKSQRVPEGEQDEARGAAAPASAGSKDVPFGWAGLALILLSAGSLFNLAPLASTMRFRANGWRALDVAALEVLGVGPSDDLAVWAICSLAGLLGWVGLVLCILALKRGSGASVAIIGLLVFLLKVGFLIARRM
jgi:hypothetical protein